MRTHFLAAVMATACVAFASTPAVASHVSVDFGPIFGPGGDGDDFGTNSVGDGTACTTGSSGPESCPLTLLNNASTGAIPLGFPIDFGNGPITSLYVNENGIVSFTGPITTTSFSSLASVGQPVIAPFFSDLTSVTFVGTVFEMNGSNFGQIMYQRGSASALPGSDGNFDQADEVPAFSVLWYGLTDASSAQVFAQLIIYSHASSAAGDFDIRFRYGQVDGDQYNTGTGTTGIAGLLLGANSLSIAGPISATTDYFYSFRGGKLVGAVAPLTLTCPAATAQVGVAYNSALTAGGGVSPYTFSNTGSLPAGLSLNTSTGALTGTPGVAGAFAFTAEVVDSSGLAAGTVMSNCAIMVSPATPQLSVTPSSVSFGTVKRFSLLYKTVTLTNTGTGPVSISKASVTPGAGTGRGDFVAVSSCGRSLASGNSCRIYVVLFALNLGSLSATLNIPNNAVGSPQTVPLSVAVIPISH
jgi:large repetitive protein